MFEIDIGSALWDEMSCIWYENRRRNSRKERLCRNP